MILPPAHSVIQSLSLLQISYRLLEKKEAEAIRSQVHKTFAIHIFVTHKDGRLWENLSGKVSIQDENAWRKIDGYLSAASFLIFFDEFEDESIIEVSKGASLARILEECTGFEFYITDPKATYLLCFNHHDFLIGSGEAMQWVKMIA